ncbi:multidrug resistance protein D [mine drainage metagenome]|uniref:Multidrug resistance protein D n=1 Tax=mine drainage metagenome TaxID=410659 RepID=A0A1J5S8M7_9ZZZZ
MTHDNISHGIRANLGQFLHQLFQVLLVGMTIGMTRTVVPALAETEFGVPRGSFTLLVAFVVGFGFVKGTLNFVAGRLAESWGRRRVLLLGWVTAIPIPILIYFAPSWDWIVAATMLLGVNQGFTWSMTQTSKLDLTRPDQRGLTIGFNEFAGYIGVAIAGIVTGYLAADMGPRMGLLVFGLAVIGTATLFTALFIKDTLPWARKEKPMVAASGATLHPRYPAGVSAKPSTREIFTLVTWRDRRFFAICQAGLVEKFVDALIWIFYPVFLYNKGVSLPGVGWIVGVYGFTWGAAQLVTGRLSDHFGRQKLNVGGMWLCGSGVALMLLGEGSAWWSMSAAVSGLGMAMLYPNLSAAVADISAPHWRASAIGTYRFWRDLGYGVGAFGLGLAAASTHSIEGAFWFVAAAMALSGLGLLILGEETHPRLNQADVIPTPQAAAFDVRVISQTPPGGRCNLYFDYGQALVQHLGANLHVDISTERDAHGHGFPSLWINGAPLKPSDGVIVMPEDIIAVLGADNITVGDDLHMALDTQLKKMLNEGE